MKKIIKWIFLIVIIGVLSLLGYWIYFSLNWTSHLIDKKIISGVKTNNSYGIRNEVYDFLVKEEFVKWKMNEEQKNLLLNVARYDQLLLENFDNVDKVIEIYNKTEILWECKGLEEWRHANYQEDYFGPSKYLNISERITKDHEIASEYYNIILAKNQTKIKYIGDYSNKEEIIKSSCEKYKKGIFDE